MADNCEVQITIRPPVHPGDKGFIAATSSYDPLPGEEHRRGSDLADGPANMATLCRVMDNIAALLEGYRSAYERDSAQALAKLPERASPQQPQSRSH